MLPAESVLDLLLAPLRLLAAAFPWYLAVQMLAFLALPVAAGLCPRLRDGGYGLSKVLGLLLAGYLSWLVAHIDGLGGMALGFSQRTILVCLGIMWLVGTVGLVRNWPELRRMFVSARRPILVTEALLLGGFTAMLVLRAAVPQITYVINDSAAEKFTDFAVLNSLLGSAVYPPQDVWVAKDFLNYYYFGHHLWAMLIRLTGFAPEVGFNLGLATAFGLTAALSFSLGFNATGRVGLGLLAAFLVVLAGNLDGAMQLAGLLKDRFVDGYGTTPWYARYDFWRPSRAIENTINEFPAFSFLLGDLHAHVSALPLMLGGMLLGLEMFQGLRRAPSLLGYEMRHLPLLALTALLAGALAAANSWDAITLGVILVAMLWAAGCRGPAGQRVGRFVEAAFFSAVLIGVGVAGFFLQFFLVFQAPVSLRMAWSGEFPFFTILRSPVLMVDVANRSHPAEFAAHWGLLLAVPAWLAVRMVAALWRGRTGAQTAEVAAVRERMAAAGAVLAAAGAVACVLWQGAVVGAFAAGAAACALALVVSPLAAPSRLFLALALAFCGLAAACELLYLDDVFDGPTERINTVFKIYYGLWPLAALGTVLALRLLGRMGSRTGWAVAVIVAAGLCYPLAAVPSRVASTSKPAPAGSALEALDGMRYLAQLHPGDYAAMQHLRANAQPGDILVEAPGTQYTYAGRMGTNTGIPAVAGWLVHSRSWRGERFDGALQKRTADVSEIYLTMDPGRAHELARHYGATLVVVGDAERQAYPALIDAKFAAMGDQVFSAGGTTVYRIREDANFPPAPPPTDRMVEIPEEPPRPAEPGE